MMTLVASASAQSCKYKTRYKGDDLIFVQSCHNQLVDPIAGKMVSSFSGSCELNLDKLDRQVLTAALRKGLAWSAVNKSKNISFSKRIAETSIQASQMERQVGGYEYSAVQVVFKAGSGSKFELVLYGDTRRNIFDIESPGSYLMSFETDKEVNEFISILKNPHENLNAVFK